MSLSLVIASVPIALPMVMKVTLAVGAKEMAKEGGIVTHLTALEEIASMVVLCSDKTGTRRSIIRKPTAQQARRGSRRTLHNGTQQASKPTSLSPTHHHHHRSPARRYSHDRPDDSLPRDGRVLLGPQR